MRRTLVVLVLAACTPAPSETDTDTPPVDTDTSTQADVFASGTLVLDDPDTLYDLETGGVAADPLLADVWTMTSTDWLALRSGAYSALGAVDGAPDGPADCGAMTSDPIWAQGTPPDAFAVGESFCVTTAEGHVGTFTITAHAGVLPELALTIDYVLLAPAEPRAPVIREPVAELAPWLDVRFGWRTDFADACEVAWFLPDEVVAARVDADLGPGRTLDDPSVPALRWEEAWGNEVRAVLTCVRTPTGQFATHTFELTRPTPTTPPPAVTSFTGEVYNDGGWYQPWYGKLSWTTTDADACAVDWYAGNGDWIEHRDGFGPTADGELLPQSMDWGTTFRYDLRCTQAATGRYADATLTLQQ